ncbi:hypothetical protein GJAV_G00014970 [Gymnothorax javanicus]|nr:hypothetical protein GJAV_G00014970 [Gymnothorax javanicus]
MDERLLRREKEERPILSAVGAGNLCNTIGHSFLSLSSSDKNQNLLEEEVEGEDNVELLQGGRELFQLDSVNNNEEMDNMTNPINWDTWHKDSSTANTQQSTETGVLGDCPAVCPLTGKSSALHLEGSSKIANASCPTSPIALLKELQEDGDHPWLPQRLHQIAEAYFFQEDYKRALQFIQLERLYHERLLSNLTALQEHWESRLNAGHQGQSQSQGWPHSDLNSTQLEILSQLCKTHQRSSLRMEKCVPLDKALKSSTRTSEVGADSTLQSCSACSSIEPGWLMEGQQSSEEVQPARCAEGQSWDTCNLDPQRRLQWSPSKDVHALTVSAGCCSIDSVDVGSGDAKGEPCGKEEPTEASLAKVDSFIPLRAGSHINPERLGERSVTTETNDEKEDRADSDQDLNTGVEWEVFPTKGLELREGVEEDFLEEDFEDSEFGDETFAATGMEAASLDELAKRIKVEQTAPTPVLVSILKRRSLLEGSPPQPSASPKQAPKRKVRFNEPDNMVDPDEVGLDSCLLLLLLCMVTMVISVGGTALYCTLGNAQSSMCTDFSHNVEFYLSQVQRGVEEVRHWLSNGS